MTDKAKWYQPRAKAKEMLKGLEEIRHGGKKEECYGRWPFNDFVVDKFYTRATFDALVVPQDYKLVKLNLGRVGETIRQDKNGNILHPDDDQTPVEKEFRDWPYGGVFDPGFHIALTPLGLSKIAVVFTGQRQDTLREERIFTRDTPLKNVEALLTYTVTDPLAALTATQDGDFKGLTREISSARLIDEINNSSIEDFHSSKGKQINFAYDYDQNGQRIAPYEPDELKRIGVRLDGIRVTGYTLPEDVEDAYQKRGEMTQKARGAAEASMLYGQAGQVYSQIPEAKEVLWTQAAADPNSKVNYDVHSGKMADALNNLTGMVGNIAAAAAQYFGQQNQKNQSNNQNQGGNQNQQGP